MSFLLTPSSMLNRYLLSDWGKKYQIYKIYSAHCKGWFLFLLVLHCEKVNRESLYVWMRSSEFLCIWKSKEVPRHVFHPLSSMWSLRISVGTFLLDYPGFPECKMRLNDFGSSHQRSGGEREYSSGCWKSGESPTFTSLMLLKFFHNLSQASRGEVYVDVRGNTCRWF